MDKPLPGKDKTQDTPETTPGGYNPALTEETWMRKKTWWESAVGRTMMRIFSRGFMGAAFFTAGGLLNRRWMHSNEVEALGEWEGKYDASKKFLEQKNPLQFLAKTIDVVIGKPIEFVVGAVAGKDAGRNAVRFRPTKFKDMEHALWEKDPSRGYYRGRSLGNETIAVTFDFFCMSVGDAIGRDMAGWFDPNVKKKWIKDGHIDFAQAAKSAVKSMARYVTYNGGEDWAVAIPYVYFMKGQRALINHYSPGFTYDFDRNLNGGSHKIDMKGNIVGNYNAEGMFDLQSRFVTYNIGTLMFRELYRHIGNRHAGRDTSLYGDPFSSHEHRTVAQKTGDVFKWVARSFVKAGIYMQFAVPFFSITRTPQTNYRGLFINVDEHGVARTLNYVNTAVEKEWMAQKKRIAEWDVQKNGPFPEKEIHLKYENVYANESMKSSATGYHDDMDMYFSRYAPDPKTMPDKHFDWGNTWYKGAEVNPRAKSAPFKVYDHASNPLQESLNTIGRANYKLAHGTDRQSKIVEEYFKKVPGLDRAARFAMSLRPNEPYNRFSHPHVYAALSYTPYFIAKTEAAQLVDTPDMDVASERMIDGATKLDVREFAAGMGEVWRAFWHKPFADPKRQEAVKRRRELVERMVEQEKDQGAIWQERIGKKVRVPDAAPELHWKERLVSGQKPEIAAHADTPKAHADREEMRKALEELHPPTNSIN